MGRYPALQKPAYDHSFESGVPEQGNIQNMQDRGSLRTRVGNHCLKVSTSIKDGTLCMCVCVCVCSIAEGSTGSDGVSGVWNRDSYHHPIPSDPCHPIGGEQ